MLLIFIISYDSFSHQQKQNFVIFSRLRFFKINFLKRYKNNLILLYSVL